MKYKYFTKCLSKNELDAEPEAFGNEGWKLVYIEHNQDSPKWYAIFIKEETNDTT